MKKNEISDLVIACFKQVLSNNNKSYNDIIDSTTPIMGSDSPFDSIDLVTFIVSLEQALEDDWSILITIAGDKAMSQVDSPFKTIGTITNYIEVIINEI